MNPPIPHDAVRHPSHYNWHPKIECKDVVGAFSFHPGAAIKYIWRAGRKDGVPAEQDYDKAIESLENEKRRLREQGNGAC